MKGNVITQYVRNVTVAYGGIIVTFAVAFFFTPFLIEKLGKDQYGIWQLTLASLGYVSLVDFGMKPAYVRYVSKYYAKGDWHGVNTVFCVAIAIYTALSVLVLVIVLLIAMFAVGRFQIPAEFVGVAKLVMIVMGFDSVFYFAMVPFTGLGAFHRFDVTTHVGIVRKVIQTLGLVFLLSHEVGLLGMALFVLFVGVVQGLVVNAIRLNLYPEMTLSVRLFSVEMAKKLFSFSAQSFLIVLCMLAIFHTDNIVVGWFVSTGAVATYSVAGALITQIRSSVGVLGAPLVPAISHFEATGDFDKIASVFLKLNRYLSALAMVVGYFTYLYAPSFIHLWLGDGFGDSVDVIRILSIGLACYLPLSLGIPVLQGISKQKEIILVLGFEASANITLSIILVKKLGLVGVALGTALPQIVIYLLIFPLVVSRAISLAVSSLYRVLFQSALFFGLFVMPPIFILQRFLAVIDWFDFFFSLCISITVAAVGFLLVILDGKERILLWQRAQFWTK